MKKRNKLMKKVAVVFCMLIAMVMMVQTPVMAKSDKNYLPKSVKVTTKSSAYSFTRTATFKYNKKKNLTEWVEAYDGAKAAITTYKYEYKKGKPTKMTQTMSYVKENKKITETYTFKKGSIVSSKHSSGNERKYSYTKYGDIKKYSDISDGGKSTYKYNYTYYKSGLPKTMKESLNNKWQATYKYNNKGLVTKVTSIDGTSKYKYKYNKNGTVKSIVCTHYNAANEIVRTQTSTYSYTKKQVSKSRYARIINSGGVFTPASF